MDVILKNVTYPADENEWFAKGNADVLADDTYFEVPAVFMPDGTCDELATQARIMAVMNYIRLQKLAQTPTN